MSCYIFVHPRDKVSRRSQGGAALALLAGLLPLLLLAVSLISIVNPGFAMPDYTGLQGPYCERLYRRGHCCPGRQDECSVPILGTLCYCDEFCANRTRRNDHEEDCCPDFFSFCRGDGNLLAWTKASDCEHRGRTYLQGAKFKENCNFCKCSNIEGKSEVLCEDKLCLMDENLIYNIQSLENQLWVARNYTSFYGRSLDEGLKLKLGTLNPSRSVYRMNPVRRIYNPEDLPKEFDSRIRWPRDISPVHDQGWCGASWAVSTVDVASDRFGIMSKGLEKVQLSAQHLLSCNSKGQQGCNGGYLDRAWLFMRKYGLTDEDCYPWKGEVSKCRVQRQSKLSDSGCRKRNSYNLRNELYRVGPAYRLGNETDIMDEILQSGPVQATMRVYHDFFNYESGIYVHSSYAEHHPSAYHSVRIVGWGEEVSPYGKTIKFWRIANSWGRDWGEDGYFRILRGVNECEIESFVLGIWAKTV
ncbi:hypothetical protein QAD02_000149 [Eretmocerus hayati]|uniref:Uncharacterized protein n=1 Tax=Eretmocerus hayati TaxID=131215 RepID=A0ACC2NCK0_9HYME|nr:hypothetical protein QAD02_000149 [Eretmocerus hayati]